MRKILLLLAGFAVVSGSTAGPRLLLAKTMAASPAILMQSGPCTLQEASAFDKEKAFPVEVRNEDVQVVFALRGDKFFEAFVVETTPRITNLSGKPKHLAYNLAFFDKTGTLIACTSSTTDLKADEKDLQAGSNMPEIPRPALATIASYQLVVYVTDGKKS